MKLCFGTIAKTLSLCSKNNEFKIVSTLAQVVDSKSRYINEKPACSKLINCKINFVDPSKEEMKPTIEVVVERTAEMIVPMILSDKILCVVLILCDIILNDKSIDSNYEKSFTEYLTKNKTTLLTQSWYLLPDFIARLLLFAVNVVDNRDGKEYVGLITKDYIDMIVRDYQDIVNDNPDTRVIVFQSQQPVDIFKELIEECHISDFISSDPTYRLEAKLVDEASFFARILDETTKQQNDGSKLYREINKFADTFEKYITCLGHNLIPCTSDMKYYVPRHRDENPRWAMKFQKKSDGYRMRINELYGQIIRN